MRLFAPSRVSRRLGERFGFKPKRDASPKSAQVRRPYPPGMHGKRRRRGLSDFGTALQEKQKVRYLYGLSDAMLKRYALKASRARAANKAEVLLGYLERRLDNVVYRLGFAPARRMARHLVSHGHFLVNGRRVRTPSRLAKPGDEIAIAGPSRALPPFEGLAVHLKQHEPPEWLNLDREAVAGGVKRPPREQDHLLPYNVAKIIEFYAR